MFFHSDFGLSRRCGQKTHPSPTLCYFCQFQMKGNNTCILRIPVNDTSTLSRISIILTISELCHRNDSRNRCNIFNVARKCLSLASVKGATLTTKTSTLDITSSSIISLSLLSKTWLLASWRNWKAATLLTILSVALLLIDCVADLQYCNPIKKMLNFNHGLYK